MDLPVWQALYEELEDKNFLPIAVALDSGGAEHARQWIEKANPTYPSLIDERHLVAELYDMINVPNAVWIDESGRIVRPAESAGASDAFRSLDIKTMTMPPAAVEDQRTKRGVYLDALRDWATKGAASVHALSPDEVRRRMAGPSDEDALAQVNFKLGLYLHAIGHEQAAQRYFDEAKRLRPESWAFKRQAWTLEQVGKAGGPEFWAAVQALGDKPYYPPVQMEGMPA
jgi:AhpC/TSA family